MKIFRNKLTGRLGETQFGEDAGVLIRNAKSANFKDDEIEIIDMTLQEYNKAIKIQDENDISPEKKMEIKKEKLIQAKIRDQAIEALKKEGKLDEEGNLKKEA